ncbi:arsenical efflux pump membrane protein ArsB, partial [Aliarcobacter cryaerophilus]
RKDIPKTVDVTLLKEPKSAIKNMNLFYFSWLFLGILLLCAYFLGDAYDLPISIFALGGATIFLIIATKYKNDSCLFTCRWIYK